MADLVTNRAEKSAIIKRFQSYGNDSMAYSRDHFEQNKCEECCELQGGRLNFYESAKPHHNTTATVVKVEKRRGTNILILRCGPGGRSVIFLEFDSKRLTDEWQEALCQYTGQPYDPNPVLRRVRSELPAAANRWRRRAITQSTFSDFVFEQVNSDAEQVETPPESLPTPSVTTPETPQEALLETPQEVPLDGRQVALPALPVTTPETPQEVPLDGRQVTLPALPVTTPETLQEVPLCGRQVALPALPVTTPETPQEVPLDDRQVALPVTTLETTQEVPLDAPQESPLGGRPEVPLAPPVAHPSAPGSSVGERVPSFTIETSNTDDCHDAQNYSGPGSLRSRDDDSIPTLADLAKNSVEKECTLSDLQKLKVKDYKGNVMMKEAIHLCHIHVGDKIVLTNARGLPMNAQEMTEHIRTSPEQTIVLTIKRGAVCIAREEEHELVINFKGYQSVIPDTVDLIRRSCTSCCSLHYAEMPERSKLTITAINNIPVAIGSQQDQIAKSMREALDTSKGFLTIRLVPQSLLDALAEEDDDTHE